MSKKNCVVRTVPVMVSPRCTRSKYERRKVPSFIDTAASQFPVRFTCVAVTTAGVDGTSVAMVSRGVWQPALRTTTSGAIRRSVDNIGWIGVAAPGPTCRARIDRARRSITQARGQPLWQAPQRPTTPRTVRYCSGTGPSSSGAEAHLIGETYCMVEAAGAGRHIALVTYDA